MERNIFVLAKLDRKVELVSVSDDSGLKVGYKFERKPALKVETWTVVKVFVREEHDRLVALVTLMGFDAVKKLFSFEEARIVWRDVSPHGASAA